MTIRHEIHSRFTLGGYMKGKLKVRTSPKPKGTINGPKAGGKIGKVK